MPSLVEGTKNFVASTALADMLVDTFTPHTKTLTSDSMGGFTETWADGTDFDGRLSILTDTEFLNNDKLTAVATHKVFCLPTVTIDEEARIKFGTRYFEITGVQKPSNQDTNPGHLEILVREID